MAGRLRSQLTYANVVSTLCLFIRLGGVAYAAVQVTGRNVVEGSLGAPVDIPGATFFQLRLIA